MTLTYYFAAMTNPLLENTLLPQFSRIRAEHV